jgi:peptide/nickel transport system ATP-binding protein
LSSNGAGPLLDVEDLVVAYPIARGLTGAALRRPERQVLAVDGISFSVDRGELVALVGESGCGKTTTAQTVLRLADATSGRVSFDGRDITELPNRALRPLRRSMQIIYQDPYESRLDPRMTVRDAVEEPMLIHGIAAARARARSSPRAVARVELTPPDLRLERYPHELSGGTASTRCDRREPRAEASCSSRTSRSRCSMSRSSRSTEPARPAPTGWAPES